MQLDASQSQKLFDAGGFLMLPLEQQGQEFGIDGSVWAVKSFAGIKFLPPGLHLFLYSAPSKSNEATFGSGIVIRKGIFRITKPQEILIRRYDATTEEVQHPSSSSESEEETIVSKEYLKSLDPRLAPYPFDKLDEWKRLTSFITERTLETVLGKDGAGDARCDALMASLADESEGASTQASEKKQFWGKPRPAEEPEDANMQDTAAKKDAKRERLLRFPVFNLKRSWRPGSTGEQLSRDSRDKSWLLSHVVATHLNGDRSELLAQMQLAFILVTQLHNFSALEAYKRFISLICRSSSMLLPNSTGLSSNEGLPLVASFLSQVLLLHLEHVRQEFFEEDLPDLDVFLLEELAVLRLALRAAQRHYDSSGDEAQFADTKEAWSELRQAVDTRFGWKLGRLETDEAASAQKGGKLHYNLLSQPDEEDEYVEEGEDAPVVVEL